VTMGNCEIKFMTVVLYVIVSCDGGVVCEIKIVTAGKL